MDELITQYGNIDINPFSIQLINIRQNGLVTKHIQQFQKFILRVKNILEDNSMDLFMGTLK
jgi:hypothetical protein